MGFVLFSLPFNMVGNGKLQRMQYLEKGWSKSETGQNLGARVSVSIYRVLLTNKCSRSL